MGEVSRATDASAAHSAAEVAHMPARSRVAHGWHHAATDVANFPRSRWTTAGRHAHEVSICGLPDVWRGTPESGLRFEPGRGQAPRTCICKTVFSEARTDSLESCERGDSNGSSVVNARSVYNRSTFTYQKLPPVCMRIFNYLKCSRYTQRKNGGMDVLSEQ